MAAITGNRFEPTISSFGELTLHHARAIRGIHFRRHRELIIGWTFAAVFLAGLGSLYALDRAAFSDHDRPVAYGGVMLDYD